jgi:hypothetical protein
MIGFSNLPVLGGDYLPRLAASAETARRRTFSAQVKIPDYKRAIPSAGRFKI